MHIYKKILMLLVALSVSLASADPGNGSGTGLAASMPVGKMLTMNTPLN